MGWLGRLFSGKGDEDRHGPPSMPWDRHPSILEHVRSHVDTDRPGLAEGGYTLPDEDRVAQGSKVRWAAGAMDGVATHHMGRGDVDKAVRKTVRRVVAYSRRPTAANKAAVYRLVIAERVVSIIDPVIEALADERNLSPARLYELARSFVTEASDREPVKFGIALLGLFRRPEDQELFHTLGRHDEFTLFCAVAIAKASEEPERALWALARIVTGWGRIHVVERLAQTTDPAIKRWLLREGFRNSVMDEYLAGTCAKAGGLLVALSEDRVDRELLTAAGEIIQALFRGGPAEGIDDYEDARPVIETYLDHMAASADTVEDFLHVHAIKFYLDEDDSQWASRYAAGWSTEARDCLRSACESVLGRPKWVDRVRVMLDSEDEVEFAHADQAARLLGIDTWDLHWRRLREKPGEPARWYHVITLCDDARIEEVVGFAEANLNLAGIATGADDEVGLGCGFEPHSCLDFILQNLSRFPGMGVSLIETGLKSPVVRNRNMAVIALAGWSREEWPGGLARSLEQAAGCEPNEGLRELMVKVLKGEPLSP